MIYVYMYVCIYANLTNLERQFCHKLKINDNRVDQKGSSEENPLPRIFKNKLSIN